MIQSNQLTRKTGRQEYPTIMGGNAAELKCQWQRDCMGGQSGESVGEIYNRDYRVFAENDSGLNDHGQEKGRGCGCDRCPKLRFIALDELSR